jgi:hypothetical protein
VLTEVAAKALLAHYGVPLPPEALATSETEAVAATGKISGAVALKVQSPDILHKTEAGAVALGLRPEDFGQELALEYARREERRQHADVDEAVAHPVGDQRLAQQRFELGTDLDPAARGSVEARELAVRGEAGQSIVHRVHPAADARQVGRPRRVELALAPKGLEPEGFERSHRRPTLAGLPTGGLAALRPTFVDFRPS